MDQLQARSASFPAFPLRTIHTAGATRIMPAPSVAHFAAGEAAAIRRDAACTAQLTASAVGKLPGS